METIVRQKRRRVYEDISSVRKEITGCCALSQLRANNFSTKEEILTYIDQAKREYGYNFIGVPHGYGERAFFIIISPHEEKLEEIIKGIGFEHLVTFGRRSGYAPGENKFYFYHF